MKLRRPDDSTASDQRAAWTAARLSWRAAPRTGLSAGRHRAGLSARAPGRWVPLSRSTLQRRGFLRKPERTVELRQPDDSTVSDQRARLDHRAFLVVGRAGGLVFPPDDTGRGFLSERQDDGFSFPGQRYSAGVFQSSDATMISFPDDGRAPGFSPKTEAGAILSGATVQPSAGGKQVFRCGGQRPGAGKPAAQRAADGRADVARTAGGAAKPRRLALVGVSRAINAAGVFSSGAAVSHPSARTTAFPRPMPQCRGFPIERLGDDLLSHPTIERRGFLLWSRRRRSDPIRWSSAEVPGGEAAGVLSLGRGGFRLSRRRVAIHLPPR